MQLWRGLGWLGVVAAMLFADLRRADACGGCFIQPTEATVVTDHRMALSISKQQTVLWDQIRYSGDPSDFAWVLPVRAGARIEVSNDELFAALDGSTQPIVYGPATPPFACALTGCGADDLASADSPGDPGGVQVLSQSVVGPYEQVTLRSQNGDSLRGWLRQNAFAIPPSIEPTIDAYVREGFDFIALKLRPECGERSMKPVRVVTPGADPSLPLRMVAAGVGAQVGIILYVITEGKQRPQNFPSTTIDDRELRWDRQRNKSNYEPLSQSIMARDGSRTWIVEYADKPLLPLTGTGWREPGKYPRTTPEERGTFSVRQTVGFSDLYYGQCKAYRGSSSYVPPFGSSSSSSSGSGGTIIPCPQADAGKLQAPAVDDGGANDDGGASDGGASDGGVSDGGVSGESDAGSQQQEPPLPGTSSSGSSGSSGSSSLPLSQQCAYLDDLDVALTGLHPADVWVTRLRSVLPSGELANGDLRLEPSRRADGTADAEPVSNLHWTPYYADDGPPDDYRGRCAGAPGRALGRDRRRAPWAIGTACAIVGAALLRRRRRR